MRFCLDARYAAYDTNGHVSSAIYLSNFRDGAGASVVMDDYAIHRGVEIPANLRDRRARV